MDREERFRVSNTTHLHLPKKKSKDLDCLGTTCQICTLNLRQMTLIGGWEKLLTDDRDNLKTQAIFTKIHTADRDDL